MLESIQSRFKLSIHFFPRTGRKLLKIVPGKKKTQRNVWNVENTTGHLLAELHPSSFVCKILFFKYLRFPIRELLRSEVKRKLFDIKFPYIHCYFKTCLHTPHNGARHRDKVNVEGQANLRVSDNVVAASVGKNKAKQKPLKYAI